MSSAIISSLRIRAALVLVSALVALASAGELPAQQPPAGGAADPKTAKPGAGQQNTASPKPKLQKSQQATQAATEAPPKSLPMPGTAQLAILVQTFMVALSQANLTNNFTVLYALSAPSFQKENPPEKLSQLFSGFRSRKIDLTPIILFSPTLVRPPEYDANGYLRMTGYYKTSPQQVHFDLLLQPIDSAWRLFGISVETKTAPAGAPPAK